MKTNLKPILSAMGVAALLAFPAMAKAQSPVIHQCSPQRLRRLGRSRLSQQPRLLGTTFSRTSATGCRLRPSVTTGARSIAFQNIGSERATLNFLFSDGTTVTASGLILAPGREFQALYNNKRIEGQFIFANTAGNTTVSLNAFDGGIFCETRGTVQFGPNPPPPPVNAPPEVSR